MRQWSQRVRDIQPRCWDINRQSDDYLNNIGNWERIYFSRKISIWLTFFLKDSRVTPNQITACWVIMGIVGSSLLISNHYWVQLFALILLYLAWLLDNVDGELARYRQCFSISGNFMDLLGHQTIPPMIFISLGIHYLLLPESPLFIIIAAMLAAVWVIPLTKMQDNVVLLLAIQALSRPHSTDKKIKPESKTNRQTKHLSSIIAFLFTDTAMFYLLILAVISQQTCTYLIFYGFGIPLMMLPKFILRNNELIRISNNPEQLDSQFRPEWKDH